MKFALNILLIAIAACAVASAAGFAELRGEYAQAMERIDAAEEKKIGELKQQYAETLDRGVVHYMRRGDLKSTLALRDERERFEEEGTIPPEISGNGHKKAQKAQKAPSPDGTHGLQPVSWDDVDDGVIRTIKRCRQRWQSINQTADRQRLELNKYYAEQLEPVEKRLTRQGRLEQALAVSKERERIAGEIARLDKLVPEEEPDFGSRTSGLEPLERIPYELREHLVAYYTFDRPGPKVRDHSGNGHHGTVHGAKWIRDGKVGGCYEFDGEDDWIELDIGMLSDALASASGVTVVLWLSPSTQNSRKGQFLTFYINEKWALLNAYVSEDGSMHLGIRSSPHEADEWTDVSCKIDVSGNGWTRVAFVADLKKKSVKLYIDQRLASEKNSPGKEAVFHTGKGMRRADRIGISSNGRYPFAGRLDDLSIFRTAASSNFLE